METSESSRSRSKRGLEDSRDARNDEDEDWEKRKHRSGKSRRHDNSEEIEDYDNGRRKSSGERSDARKKSGGSGRVDSADEDEYEIRRDSRSKIPSKETEDRGERRSGDGYRDRDQEGSRRSRDDENERSSSKKERLKSTEGSQSKARSRPESNHDIDHEKTQDRDSKYSDRKESSRDKGHEDREQDRNPSRRRWDEVETSRKAEESGYRDKSDPRGGKASEHDRHGASRDRAMDPRNELGESRGRALDSGYEKGGRPINRDDRRADGESSRNRGRSEAQDEDYKPGVTYRDTRSDIVRDDKQRTARERSPGLAEHVEPTAHPHNDRLHGDKGEKYRQDRDSAYGSRDEVENREKSFSMDEDGHARMRDRSGRDVRHDRSRTPERSARNRRESDERDRGFSESDNERGISVKTKEWEDGYRDDRSSKGKDSSWDEKNREREGSRDYWKRSQTRHDVKDGEKEVDHLREWDSQRHEQDRADREKLHGRPGYRKDSRMRSDGVRSEYTDSIEIRPNKNLDFGREEPVATFPGRRSEGVPQQDFAAGASADVWGNPPEDKGKMTYGYGDDLQERYQDDGSSIDQNSQAGKGRGQKGDINSSRSVTGQSASGGLQPSFGNYQGSGSFNRTPQQGQKGGRPARGGRGRANGRDAQRVGMPLPLMAPPPFGHLGLPPGPMQPIGPNIPHTPGPPIGPTVFLPQYTSPVVWPNARGIDMNMLPVLPNLPPMPPPGPGGPRFAPNMGTVPAHGLYFNQAGAGRGVPTNISDTGFNGAGPIGRGPHDKAPSSWGPHRTSGPSGKAPSRGEQNDYSQNFVDTGMRPQNFIRELEITSVVEDYPKLRELIQRKDEIVAKSASPPMYFKCDLKEHTLSPEFFGTKFDVILVDPPWEEYAHRAPGVTDHIDCWTFEEIQNLKIEAIADTPSFIFLWVGDGMGLEQGRQCLKKWGFRRCEDICWVKTNKKNATSGLRHDSNTLFQHSKEHCLMGIKGTVRRSTDGHIIHANIDTDIIIAEEPTDGSTKKPEDMYRIIEHFSLGRRRLELFGEDHNIRSGWLTVGKGLSSSNFNSEAYTRNFADKDGKVWQGGGGRNPPPDAPHLVQTTPEIESLRPRSPPPKNQQQQPIPPMPSASSNSRRPTGNSPQNPTVSSLSGLNQDQSIAADSLPPVPWAPQMVGLRGPEFSHGAPDERVFDGYGFNVPYVQPMGEHFEYDAR